MDSLRSQFSFSDTSTAAACICRLRAGRKRLLADRSYSEFDLWCSKHKTEGAMQWSVTIDTYDLSTGDVLLLLENVGPHTKRGFYARIRHDDYPDERTVMTYGTSLERLFQYYRAVPAERHAAALRMAASCAAKGQTEDVERLAHDSLKEGELFFTDLARHNPEANPKPGIRSNRRELERHIIDAFL